MSSNSVINASIPGASKDFSKKKRANRSAKLKQCKLDARRQQWLSQVDNKGPKVEVNGNGNGNGNESRSTEFNQPIIEARKGKIKKPCAKGVEIGGVSVEHNDGDWEGLLMADSPTSSVNDAGNNYAGSSGSSTSSNSSASSISFGSGGCCSGSITEEEEGRGVEFDGDDGCLDDWETVADALVDAATKDKQRLDGVDFDSAKHQAKDQNVNAKAETEEGKSESVAIPFRGGENCKAWRRDDASRPQSLPNLSKQGSLNPWVRKMPPVVPTSCPICCEDLDFTDSSFVPCPCGFRLCLFCHKRIVEEDARCPGCRKPYSSEAAKMETSISGGSLTIQLGRSCSMFSRV